MTGFAETTLARMGIASTDVGPYVTELRTLLMKMQNDGARSMHFSWGPDAGKIGPEGRAKEMLAWEWAIKHGDSYPVRSMNGLYTVKTDVRTMQRSIDVHWDAIPGWFLDRFGQAKAKIRRVFAGPNPYR